MDVVQSPADEQEKIAMFLEIAAGQTADTASQFLKATGWKLEDAIQLFYVGNEDGTRASFNSSPVLGSNSTLGDQTPSGPREQTGDGNARGNDVNDVRAPIPVRRDVLYDNAMLFGPRMGHASHEAHSVVPFRNFNEEANLWAPDQAAASSTADTSQDNLASLYRPPFALMHHGTFESAKNAAKLQNKWFIVNVQSTKEFSSHMLNRDTWANETVAQTISTNFIFWQAYDDTEEGRKVCTYYKLNSAPEILVIDPITGQKMRSWHGMVQPESLLEDLLVFMDASPNDHHTSLSNKRPRESAQTLPHKVQENLAAAEATTEDEELVRALAASMENVKDSGITSMDKDVTNNAEKEEEKPEAKKPTYPSLPEEPTGDRNLLCRVGVRLPDGRRLQRNFLRTDPIQLLWSFCYSELKEEEYQPFRLTQSIPGASKTLDYESNLTFADSGLANSMISVTWE